MTLSELLRLREQVDIRADRLAKAKSNAYYTSPQWGNAGSGKTTEHSDRTAKAVEPRKENNTLICPIEEKPT